MNNTLNLEALMREHMEREAVHADLFKRVAPEAICAQDAIFHTHGVKDVRQTLGDGNLIVHRNATIEKPTTAFFYYRS